MNLDSFKTNFKVMQSENRWGRIIIAIGLLCILVLSSIAFFQKPVITLIPPYLTEEASVHHNKAEAGVHSAWSLFMSETLGNVTPATSAFVRKTIDPLLGPAIRNEALSLLEQQIDTIRRDQLSYSFEAREVQFDDRTGTSYVTGRHYTHQGIGNPERVNRTYEFRWEFKNYMPNLVHLDTYEGAPRVKQQN